jgi:glutaminyl-tRNA synthetase
MGVLNPLRVVIENYPGEQSEEFVIINNPEDESAGTRHVPFSRELFIERDDFREDPPKKFFRLAPGREVRLRGAYFITCTKVVKDADGHVTELRCTYDPATRGGDAPDGRKVKATLHWVAVPHALTVEVRLYDRLFKSEMPDTADYLADLNPVSLDVIRDAKIEPTVREAPPGTRYQFERLGYFCIDPDSVPDRMVFNRTVTLKDTWARIERRT